MIQCLGGSGWSREFLEGLNGWHFSFLFVVDPTQGIWGCFGNLRQRAIPLLARMESIHSPICKQLTFKRPPGEQCRATLIHLFPRFICWDVAIISVPMLRNRGVAWLHPLLRVSLSCSRGFSQTPFSSSKLIQVVGTIQVLSFQRLPLSVGSFSVAVYSSPKVPFWEEYKFGVIEYCIVNDSLF